MNESFPSAELVKIVPSRKQRLAFFVDFQLPAVVAAAFFLFCVGMVVRRYLQTGRLQVPLPVLLVLLTVAALVFAVILRGAVVFAPRAFSVFADGRDLYLRTRGRTFAVRGVVKEGALRLKQTATFWVKLATDKGTVLLCSRDENTISETCDALRSHLR